MSRLIHLKQSLGSNINFNLDSGYLNLKRTDFDHYDNEVIIHCINKNINKKPNYCFTTSRTSKRNLSYYIKKSNNISLRRKGKKLLIRW